MHCLGSGAALVLPALQLPAGHRVHAVPSKKLPGAQAVQLSGLVALAARVVYPSRHRMHVTLRDVALDPRLQLPTGQATQDDVAAL